MKPIRAQHTLGQAMALKRIEGRISDLFGPQTHLSRVRWRKFECDLTVRTPYGTFDLTLAVTYNSLVLSGRVLSGGSSAANKLSEIFRVQAAKLL